MSALETGAFDIHKQMGKSLGISALYSHPSGSTTYIINIHITCIKCNVLTILKKENLD